MYRFIGYVMCEMENKNFTNIHKSIKITQKMIQDNAIINKN